MIRSIFSKAISVFKSRNEIIIFKLNDRIGPIDRSMTYTEPLEKFLNSRNWGTIPNEGTFLDDNKEISGCDIYVELTKRATNTGAIEEIKLFLEEQGIPKGSTLTISSTNECIPIGKMEGLALYLNKRLGWTSRLTSGQIGEFAQKLHSTIGHTSNADRSWASEDEDAVYFYNASFEMMQYNLKQLLTEYNLIGFERIVQIA